MVVFAALGAIAEAADRQFHELAVWVNRHGGTGARSDTVVRRNSERAWAAAVVEVGRFDGLEISWSVTLGVTEGSLSVSATVETFDPDTSDSEVLFERSAVAPDIAAAVVLIGSYSTDVCAQRQWWTSS